MAQRNRYAGILERATIELMFRSGIPRVVAQRYAGRGAIHMFHSVVPDRSAYLTHELRASTKFVDRLLASFRRADIDILSIDDLIPRLRSTNRRRFVVMTFDDGYADLYHRLLPVLKRQQAPATVCVSTGAIDGRILWFQKLFAATVDGPHN